jgi:hypothetical protein
MTLNQFLTDNTITAVEISEDYQLMFNVYVGQTGYGLDIDTSHIPYGTQLTMRADFTIQDNILSVAGISIDTTSTQML